MIHSNHYYNRFFTKQRIELKAVLYMATNLYYSCSNAIFYWKTLCIENQHNIGSCILDVLLPDRNYIYSLKHVAHASQIDISMI